MKLITVILLALIVSGASIGDTYQIDWYSINSGGDPLPAADRSCAEEE
jgi:hypothetical protein